MSDVDESTCVGLPQSTDDSYTITLNSSSEEEYRDVQLAGTTGDGSPFLAQVAGMLYSNGVDLSAGTSALVVDGVASSPAHSW